VPAAGASVSGPDGAGIFTVTGMQPGTTYGFKITSTNYEDFTLPGGYTASAGGVFNPPAITLTPKPATATITVAGGAASASDVTVTCSTASIVGTKSGSTWTFTLPTSGSYTFTADATGFQATTSSAYTWQPNGTFSTTLTPAADPTP
jgi:hypothetical protein